MGGGGGGGGGGFNQRPNMYMGGGMGNSQPQQEVSQVDRVVKINQIKFIIMRLGELYKGNEQIELILNNALHLVNQEKMEASADELQVKKLHFFLLMKRKSNFNSKLYTIQIAQIRLDKLTRRS